MDYLMFTGSAHTNFVYAQKFSSLHCRWWPWRLIIYWFLCPFLTQHNFCSPNVKEKKEFFGMQCLDVKVSDKSLTTYLHAYLLIMIIFLCILILYIYIYIYEYERVSPWHIDWHAEQQYGSEWFQIPVTQWCFLLDLYPQERYELSYPHPWLWVNSYHCYSSTRVA